MLKIQGFYESFWINLINLVILSIVYPTVFSRQQNDNTSYYSMLVYSFFIMMTVLCSYFFDRKQREYFFLNLLDKKKAKWLTSVFDNMNNGFLSFKGNSIMYCNSFLFQKLFKSKLQTSVRSNNKLISRNYGECMYLFLFTFNIANCLINHNLFDEHRSRIEDFHLDTDSILSGLLNNLDTDSISKSSILISKMILRHAE
jgi:c-di-AMP phosphodiesterase-like protein